jgi:hypothetical protein
MKKNENGFSAIEGLLVLVVVGVIGFAGWYVWQSKNKTNQSLANANNTSTSATVPKGSKKPIESTAPKPAAQQYLEIKEWNVKVPLSDEIKDLKYEVTTKGLNLHDKNQAVIKFYTQRLKDAQGVCSNNNFPVTLNRGISSDIPVMGDGPGPDDSTSNTYGYLYDHNTIQPDGGRIHVGLIKIGTYYYTDALFPGSSCDNAGNAAVVKATNAEPIDAIVKAVKAMQPL